MNEATKQAALSALRSALVFVGAWLVAKGWFTEAAWNDLIGGIMVAAPLLWGVWDKFASERKAEAREVVAMNEGIKVADATVGPTPAVAPEEVRSVLAAARTQ